MNSIRLHRCLAVFSLMATLAGCAQFDFDMTRNIPWKQDEVEAIGQPTKLVAMWRETVLNHGDRPAVRGFGGRLMFYGEDEGKPIQVEGTLQVYAFNETDRPAGNVAPDRKFVITEEQFGSHHSKSMLGDSYSVWIPWDRLGGDEKEITLLCRFASADGGITMSDQTTHSLPGKPPTGITGLASKSPWDKRNASAATADSPVVQTSFEAETNRGPSGGRTGMTTTTISIPNRVGGKLPRAQSRNFSRSSTAVIHDSNARILAPANHRQRQAPAPQTGQPRSNHFGRERFRPLGTPLFAPNRGRAPWPQRPQGLQSDPALSPVPAAGR